MKPAEGMMSNRPKIACFSPLAPDPSGVSDYTEELLPHLLEYWDIDLFVSGYEPTSKVVEACEVIDVEEADVDGLLPGYDNVIYHIGNSPSHIYAYETLLRNPGLVVLHDLVLANLLVERAANQGRPDRLLAEMRAQHGDEAAELARRWRYLAAPAPWRTAPFRYCLNRRVAENATAVLVHSKFAQRELQRQFPDLSVTQLDLHAQASEVGGFHSAFRRDHGGEFTIVTAGFLTPTKGIETTLRALAKLRNDIPFHYRLVGRVAPDFPLASKVRDLGLDRHVSFYGRVEKQDLYRHIADADVCINLRYPDHGESSAMVMRVLASGCPVIVSASGWFAELPDQCALKIPAGDEPSRIEALEREIRALVKSPDLRRRLSKGALEYAAELTPESRAAGYRDFELQHRPTRAEGVLGQAAVQGARDLGIDESSTSYASIQSAAASLE